MNSLHDFVVEKISLVIEKYSTDFNLKILIALLEN
jgi:hypothetical protein